ncbi:LOW QUALITY PROTEIN: putative F-box protein At1g65770 [Prosopis cineraria]|uniref:LOW QUALITY PROTEIN: putative F-box protein At1g65770 n=1 Tax=Prosopis cineraria TaxID=364024 RepID=UPI0024108297|nr:LOW QUALITY PROTEIN: putative F-box protein At1g65770 [Prosopis cineraria]
MDDRYLSVVNWSDLPKELWLMIGKCFKSHIDLLRFRSTCSLWRRSSVLPSRTVSPSFTPIIATSSGQPTHRHHNLSYRTFRSLRNCFNFFFSSPKVWLIKVEESNYGRLCLLDPFTCSRLLHFRSRYPSDSFPKVLNLLNFRFVELVKAYSISLSGSGLRFPLPHREISGKVVAFPNFAWTQVENCRFFTVNSDGKLGFSKIGDDEWTLVDYKNFYYDDIIVHKDQLYVVDRWGTIYWVDCSSLKLVQFSPPLCGLGKKKHLVESCGSLYVVDMHVEGDPNNNKGTYYEVVDLKVYKLDEEWGRWLDVKSLDERAFVLSKDCNFSLSAQDYHGCEENCVYFSYRGCASMFSLETSTFCSANVFWPCPTLFNT